jgi:hypothetical protein
MAEGFATVGKSDDGASSGVCHLSGPGLEQSDFIVSTTGAADSTFTTTLIFALAHEDAISNRACRH